MPAKEYYPAPVSPRSDKFHVICPDGFPIYDDAPYGDDKPKIFDEDRAIEVAQELNESTTNEEDA